MRRMLTPLSWLYGLGVRMRNRRYDAGRGVVRLPVPVVSVGNITVGGSGKTPFVAALARVLEKRGEPVAIVSRGYGRRDPSPYVLVSNGESVLVTPDVAGDEPFELATDLPSVAVAVGPDRAVVGRRLVEELGPRVLVLDDGFQHRRLHRDLDLVCVDTSESRLDLLPVGRLREPVASLERADALVAQGGNPDFAPPGLPVVRTSTRIVGFERLGEPAVRPLPASHFAAQPVGLFCGVARPERVRASLPANIVFFHARRDHHWWSESELEKMARAAKAEGARALLTTGKDAVKLHGLRLAKELPLPLYRIRMECRIEEPAVLERLLRDVRLSPE